MSPNCLPGKQGGVAKMRRRLNDMAVKTLKADGQGRLDVSDAGCPGLQLRVLWDESRKDKTRRIWAVEYRIKGGPKRKLNIGENPAMTLSQARRVVEEIRAEARRGIDRVVLEVEAKRAKIEAEKAREAEQAAKANVRTLLDEYAGIALRGLKTKGERMRQLEAAFAPYMDTAMADLAPSQLQAVIDAKAKDGKVAMGNRVRAALRAFTKWAAGRGRIPIDIGERLQKAGKEVERDVVLTLAEVRAIFEASADLPKPWGAVFRLLVLTGQRRGVIVGLRWRDIREDECAIVKMGRDQKDGKTHTTHLTEAAWGCLPKRERQNAFVFGTTKGASNISQMKSKLDEMLGDRVQSWTLHDLRTALATGLAEHGVEDAVADRILNHTASGSKPSAVARTYNRSARLNERREALELWSRLVTDQKADVVALHG